MIENPNLNDCGLCGSPLYLNDKQGYMVCKGCGLVTESRIVDQTAEYRVFKEDQGENNPTRVGRQVDIHLTRQIELITIDDKKKYPYSKHFGSQTSPEDAYYIKAMIYIRKYCLLLDSSALVGPSIDLLNEIKDEPSIRGKRIQTTVAAVVYLAGRRTMNLIDLKSFINIADTTFPKLLKACGTILKLIPRIIVRPFDIIKKYSIQIGLEAKDLSSLEKLCSQIEESDVLDGRLPKNNTIAASVLYFYSLHHPNLKLSFTEIKDLLSVESDSLIRSYVASISSKKDQLAKGWEPSKPSDSHK